MKGHTKKQAVKMELSPAQMLDTEKIRMYLGGRTEATINAIAKDTKVPMATLEFYLDYLVRVGEVSKISRGSKTLYALPDYERFMEKGGVMSQKEYDGIFREIRKACSEDGLKASELTLEQRESYAVKAICKLYPDRAQKLLPLFARKEVVESLIKDMQAKVDAKVEAVAKELEAGVTIQDSGSMDIIGDDTASDTAPKDEKARKAHERKDAREDALTLYIADNQPCTTSEIAQNYGLLPGEVRMKYGDVCDVLRSLVNRSGSYIARLDERDNGQYIYVTTTIPLDVKERIEKRKTLLGDDAPLADVKVSEARTEEKETETENMEDEYIRAETEERREDMRRSEVTEYVFVKDGNVPIVVTEHCTYDQAVFGAQLVADMTGEEVKVEVRQALGSFVPKNKDKGEENSN